MKSVFAAVGIAAGLASAACAADLTAQAPVVTPPLPQPALTWTGAYIGFEGGYGWTAGDIPETLFDKTSGEVASGGGAAIFGGYDYQFDNNLVVGLEGSYGYDWNEHDYTVVSVYPFLNGQTVTFETEWQATIGGRLGYAFRKALVYATGGYAATNIHGTFSLTGRSYDEVMNGWTIGAGIDYAVNEHVFARLQATYADYGTTDLISEATGLAGLPDSKLSQAHVMAGIGFRF
ncbi:outer membrane protein [Martelella endophytica]|uniref:outer membrane protein n=1 Tax=Martelella endophytica TaxID=1486262 RepID=UPI000697BDE4|nr:outer membrane beta-barrel protein [Martelella endophytica]